LGSITDQLIFYTPYQNEGDLVYKGRRRIL